MRRSAAMLLLFLAASAAAPVAFPVNVTSAAAPVAVPVNATSGSTCESMGYTFTPNYDSCYSMPRLACNAFGLYVYVCDESAFCFGCSSGGGTSGGSCFATPCAGATNSPLPPQPPPPPHTPQPSSCTSGGAAAAAGVRRAVRKYYGRSECSSSVRRLFVFPLSAQVYFTLQLHATPHTAGSPMAHAHRDDAKSDMDGGSRVVARWRHGSGCRLHCAVHGTVKIVPFHAFSCTGSQDCYIGPPPPRRPSAVPRGACAAPRALGSQRCSTLTTAPQPPRP
jgi:hypothetical protein